MQTVTLTRYRSAIRFHDLAGRGTPLLFIHGLGCASSCDYPAVAAHTSLQGRRRLLVDLLGAGFSDRPEDFGYTMDEHAQTVVDLVDALGLAKVHLFGHSMGGAIAIVAARLCGARVGRVVLSEPNLDPGGGVFSRPIAAESEADFVRAGHARTVRAAVESGNSVWAGSLAVWSPAALHRSAVSLVAGSTPTWREQLATLRVPRTVIFGERSLPDPDTKRLPALGVIVRIVRGAGHSMASENPAGLARAIAAALG